MEACTCKMTKNSENTKLQAEMEVNSLVFGRAILGQRSALELAPSYKK